MSAIHPAIAPGTPAIYAGTPLDTSKRQIRLIRSLGPSFVPAFDIAAVALDDYPHYKALSYVWGNEEASQTIIVKGFRFLVRPNLYNFLSKISQESNESYWIFVDAICINQGDWIERQSQVSLMGNVYKDASEVIAWIGPTPTIRKEHQSTRPPNAGQLISLDGHFFGKRRVKQIDPQMEAVREVLLKRKYCSRLWIVEEILLARKATIYCGDIRVGMSSQIFWKTTTPSRKRT